MPRWWTETGELVIALSSGKAVVLDPPVKGCWVWHWQHGWTWQDPDPAILADWLLHEAHRVQCLIQRADAAPCALTGSSSSSTAAPCVLAGSSSSSTAAPCALAGSSSSSTVASSSSAQSCMRKGVRKKQEEDQVRILAAIQEETAHFLRGCD